MISAPVEYKNLGLIGQEIEVAVRCEALAVKLLDAGFPVKRINEALLDFLRDPINRMTVSNEDRRVKQGATRPQDSQMLKSRAWSV